MHSRRMTLTYHSKSTSISSVLCSVCCTAVSHMSLAAAPLLVAENLLAKLTNPVQ